MSARAVGLVVVIAAFTAAVLACRQILGVADLQVDAAACGSDASRETTTTSCNDAGVSFEDCYTCCSKLDGGDPSFYTGALLQCACGPTTGCPADCPVFCNNMGGTDQGQSCDICVFDSFATSHGTCTAAASEAGAQGGASLIYQCALQCPLPTAGDCSGLSTLKECHDCCENIYDCAALTSCLQLCAQRQ